MPPKNLDFRTVVVRNSSNEFEDKLLSGFLVSTTSSSPTFRPRETCIWRKFLSTSFFRHASMPGDVTSLYDDKILKVQFFCDD